MPYIKQARRVDLNPTARHSYVTPRDAGELNFLLTKVVHDFITNQPNYAKLNEAIGALECCKLELYRRVAAPYEDRKITENGDVLP